MHAYGSRSQQGDERAPGRPARLPQTPGRSAPEIQRLAGNAAFAKAVEAQRHAHGPGCGHTDAAQAPVQRRMAVPESAHDHGHDHDHDHKAEVEPGMDSIAEATSTPGKRLPSRIIETAEAHYPMKFGHVLMHNEPVAQRSAEAFGARAYTTGSHIVSSETQLDDETMLHEVDHVYQQAMGQVAGTANKAGAKVSDPRDSFERSAAANGKRMANGQAPDLSLPGGGGA
ncbi:DUF4157 domain-containing protein [Streptomyces sp. NPDC059070]|uniref:eCIS core domain-containing protein n=1 Tax=unclassified Streptomyces TaxID=2593676 RepID=UPI0034E25BFF